MKTLLLVAAGIGVLAVMVFALMATGPSAPVVSVPEDGNCVCTKEYNPVCGADGQTYGNACMAICAKMDIVNAGACGQSVEPTPTPIPMPPVLIDPMPAPEPDMCVCTMQYDPVCGVDGKTYGNGCSASCAKVSVSHQGECAE